MVKLTDAESSAIHNLLTELRSNPERDGNLEAVSGIEKMLSSLESEPRLSVRLAQHLRKAETHTTGATPRPRRSG